MAIEMKGFAEAIRLYVVEAPTIIEEEELLLGEKFARETKEVAQDFLWRYVYSQPEPKDYTRTHRTMMAVKARVVMEGSDMVAEGYIDPEDYESYHYYLALEYGIPGTWYQWGRPAKTYYHPRPFWRSTKAEMRARYRSMEEGMVRMITTRINGRFA